MPSTFKVIPLGSLPRIDVDENDGALSERAHLLVGMTFGSAGDPLFDDAAVWSLAHNGSQSPLTYEPENNGTFDSDYFRIDGGGSRLFDNYGRYNSTITYTDGSTASVPVSIAQDSSGNSFWVPNPSYTAEFEVKPIQSLTLNSLINKGGAHQLINLHDWQIAICFGRGTQIATQSGLVAVEDLSSGDRVMTLDCGFQPIRWIGSRKLDSMDLDLHPKLRPIRIQAGALGKNLPEQDLTVSPQHRMMLSSPIAERIFGEKEALIPANKLLPLDGIDIVGDADSVEYFHMLFDRHQIVFANGTPSESLFTGPEALKALSSEAYEEITTLSPEVLLTEYVPTPARHIPEKGKLIKELVQRHQKNLKPLLDDVSFGYCPIEEHLGQRKPSQLGT